MKRKFRLRRSTDFKRVRRLGKSYAHPLVVLIKHPNQEGYCRVGIAAGRSIGNAVQRNRAKRRIREIVRHRLATIQTGWDLILLARQPIHSASYQELQAAIDQLILKAGISDRQHVH
jgi:ribonuclease P protein component